MIDHVLTYTVPAAYAVLPMPMQSSAATALLVTIGLQESRFMARRQIGGPAKSFWQFERAGVQGVLTHRLSGPHLRTAASLLQYPLTPMATSVSEVYAAIEHNDTLACCCARLLLWTIPDALPGPDEPEVAWLQYLEGWRPGKPHRATWDALYQEAWTRVVMATKRGSNDD